MSYYKCNKDHLNFLCMGTNPPKTLHSMTCSECSKDLGETSIRTTLYLVEEDLMDIRASLIKKQEDSKEKCYVKSIHWFYKLTGDNYCRLCGTYLRTKRNSNTLNEAILTKNIKVIKQETLPEKTIMASPDIYDSFKKGFKSE